jgi:glutamyl-tRNA reductase
MFDRLGLVGLTWRSGGRRALERFTLPAEGRGERLAHLKDEVGARGLVYLATCNRVEVAFVAAESEPLGVYRPRIFAALTGREPEPGEAERTLRAWAGEGAAEHLFLVAAGLDSAQLGEREIRGQMRDALHLADETKVAGADLRSIFEDALRVAKQVHRTTAIGLGRTSLAEIALDHVRTKLDQQPGAVALVGVSPMTVTCAHALASAGVPLLIVNRTLGRAAKMVEDLGSAAGEAVGLDAFCASPAPVAAVISATAARRPVLDAAAVERLAERAGAAGLEPLLVDMAIPPDVDAEAARRLGLELVTMDEISSEAERNRDRRLHEVATAREEIDRSLVDLRRRLAERWVGPVLAGLSRRYRDTALEGVDRLLRRELAGASDEEREGVRRWALSLAKRFAHIPALGLRALAYESGSRAVETFLAASDDGLARELREAARALPERELEDEL